MCVCRELEDDNYSKANTVTLHMNYLSALYTRISRPRFKQCLNKAKFFQIIVCFVDDCLFRICLWEKIIYKLTSCKSGIWFKPDEECNVDEFNAQVSLSREWSSLVE